MVEELIFLHVTFEFSYGIRRFLKNVEEEQWKYWDIIKEIRLKYRNKKKNK